MSTRRSVTVKLAAQADTSDDVEDLTSSLHVFSFEEREKRTREEIQEIEAELRLAELVEHLQRLKEGKDSICRGGRPLSSCEETDWEMSSPPQMAAFAGTVQEEQTDKMALPAPS